MKIFSPQTFAAKVAMLCRGGCKRLRQRLQTFAAKVANVCGKKRSKLAPKSPVLFWTREKGGKTHHSVPCSPPQEISAESVLCYRKESAWEAFVDGLDVAEQFITSQSSLGTGNEIWWQLFPLVPKLVHVSLSLP